MSPISAILLLTATGAAQAGSVQSTPSPSPAPIASIGFLTAGELADRCQRQSPTDTSYCFAFIAGVHDTAQAYERWLSTREFCPASALSHSDLRRSFLTYVSAYPSAREGVAASVVIVALKQTFPC